MARVDSESSSDEETMCQPSGSAAISSDSDSSITSEEEDGSKLEEIVTELENKIAENPYVYADHVELLRNLHQLDSVPRIRTAYERLSNICPMSPSQWLQWLQFEVKSTESVEDRKELHKLFDRAFLDCYSIHIYTEWCAMSLSNGENEVDTRSVIKKALKLAGSDPVDGAMIWDTAREYELALLSVTPRNTPEFEQQVMRVFEIFGQQLSRPLLQAEKTLEEFRGFAEIMESYITNCEKLTKKHKAAHQTSESVLKKFLEFENELEDTDDNETKIISEKFATYVKYINYAKTLLDDDKLTECDIVNLLGVLYDRVTSECVAPAFRGETTLPDDAEKICMDYIEYAREFGDDNYHLGVIEKVIKRFCRKSSFWIFKLQQLERMKVEFSQIKNEFESSLFRGFDTADDYTELWISYLEALRRNTDFGKPEQIEILRKTFRLAWDSLSQMWGDEADKEFTILQFWGRIEYQLAKDYDYGKDIWEEILNYGDNKLRGGLWSEYIAMERLRGGVEAARTLYKRAVRISPDPRLQHAWLSLERDHGTLDTLNECVGVCKAKAAEWAEQRAKIDGNKKTFGNKFNRNKNDSRNDRPPKQADKKAANNLKDLNNDVEMADESLDRRPNNKYDRKDNLKRKSNNVDKTPTKRVRFEQDDDSYDMRMKRPRSYICSDEEKNSRTVFISNLDFKVNEKALKDKMSEFGTLEEFHLISGVKTFGSICYCIYKDGEAVDVALSNDRKLFNDRPMFISRYNPSKDSREKHFTYSTGIERNKLFVKNLPFEQCTDDKLRAIFEPHGKLKDVRIVSHKTGKPKGLAYIEYEDDESAKKALTATDGMDLNGRALSVALSAPPPRKTAPTISAPITTTRSHSRTMLFVPTTVIQRSNDDVNNPSTSKSMTNADFKNLLLKK